MANLPEYTQKLVDELGLANPFAEGSAETYGIGERYGSSFVPSEAGESPFAEATPSGDAYEASGAAWEAAPAGNDPPKLAEMLAIPGRFDDPMRDPSIDKDGTAFSRFLGGIGRREFAAKWLSGRPALAKAASERGADLGASDIAKAWFVIHDVGVEASLKDERFKASDPNVRKGSVHGFLNRAGYYAATHDFAKNKMGTVYEFLSRKGKKVAGGKTISIETVPDVEVARLLPDGRLPPPTNPQIYASIGYVRRRTRPGAVIYYKWTKGAFDVLADLYILASARAGHLLTVTAHKEMDRNLGRSVVWREYSASEIAKATNKFLVGARDRPSDYHGDPYAFDIQPLYDRITQKLNALGALQMPPDARYGIHPLRLRKADGGDVLNGDGQLHEFPHQSNPRISEDRGLKKPGWWKTSSRGPAPASSPPSANLSFERVASADQAGEFDSEESFTELHQFEGKSASAEMPEGEHDLAGHGMFEGDRRDESPAGTTEGDATESLAWLEEQTADEQYHEVEGSRDLSHNFADNEISQQSEAFSGEESSEDLSEDTRSLDMLALEALLEAEAGPGTGLSDRLKGVATFLLGPTLRRGNKGVAVAALQGALVKLGYDIAIDGDFGPNTENAVRELQRSAELSVDGIVGPATKSALGAEVAKRSPTPPPPPASKLDPARWEPILRSAYPGTPTLQSGNAVKFLVDGAETFREMVAAIRSANAPGHFIYLLGWVCIDDFELVPRDPSTSLRALLAGADKAGAQVRAMLWQQISGSSCLKRNTDAVNFISQLSKGAAILDNETQLTYAGIKTGSHHQKVLVVQGEAGLIAFCGGVDINSDRIMTGAGCQAFGSGVGGAGHPLHDVHCRIDGPSAYDLLQTFIMRWRHNPDSDGWDAKKGRLIGQSTPPPQACSSATAGASSVLRTCSVGIARTFLPANARLGPRRRECNIRRLLVRSIAAARRFIYLEDQYLISLEAARLLNAAAPRLQHITILTTASEIASDLRCPWELRRDFLKALTTGLNARDAAKVRVFHLKTPGMPSWGQFQFGDHTYIHAKCWVFDDELAVIGSANCNKRGWETDSEVNAFVFDDAASIAGNPISATAPTFAQALRMRLWSEHLGLPPALLADGVASVQHWRSPTPTARIGTYAPTSGKDPLICLPDDVLDPGLACAPI